MCPPNEAIAFLCVWCECWCLERPEASFIRLVEEKIRKVYQCLVETEVNFSCRLTVDSSFALLTCAATTVSGVLGCDLKTGDSCLSFG